MLEKSPSQENTTSFQSTTEELPQSLFIIDFQSRKIVYANEDACREFSTTLETLSRWGLENLEHYLPGFSTWNDKMKELKKQGQLSFQTQFQKTRKAARSVEVQLRWLQEEKFIICSVKDLALQKTTQAVIQESEAKLQRITEAIPGAVFQYRLMHDDTQSFLFLSKGAHELFGIESGKIIENFELAWNLVHSEDQNGLWKSIKQSASQKSRWAYEFRVQLPSGEMKWLRGTSIPEMPPRADGSIVWNGILVDNTERKNFEQHLEQKNMALRELLNQIEIEKKAIKDSVLMNVENFLMPIIRKLQKKGSEFEEKHLKLLEKNLEELTSSFGQSLGVKLGKLTPKEIEICNMIKNGLTAKEISAFMHTSIRTVETHRHSIRKKIGLTNKKVNLASYLKTL